MKAAFIGLGKMGYPIAGHLARSGHDVTVHNRTHETALRWQREYGGQAAATAAEAAAGADMVFTCLADIAMTREILCGAAGVLAPMQVGAILVDHATGTPEFARELAALAQARKIGFLDAPVTGGVPGAVAGTLGIMAGGDAETFARAAPVMQNYAATIRHMGPAGAGHMTKLVNVICGIGMGHALAEGLAFGRRAGLDMERLIEVLMAGSSRSYLLEHKGPAMLSGTHLPASFTVDLAISNISQALAEAAALGAKLPVLSLAGRDFAALQAQGCGGWDTSSVIKLFE
jgi:3-hydroxyisobutyrate dehydrogenase-like beta-hydroxyacid dehydrogenase